MSYTFRKNADLGEWCSILLPSCLLSLAYSKGGELYSYLFVVCSWLVTVHFVKNHFLIRNLNALHSSHTYSLITSILISLFIWKWFSFYSCFFHVLALNYFTTWFYFYTISTLLKRCPGSFTLGEAQILAQSITLFFLSGENILSRKFSFSRNVSGLIEVPDHAKCLQVLLSGCLILIYLTYISSTLRRRSHFFVLFVFTSTVMFFAWWIYLRDDIFTWLLKFCLQYQSRVFLLLFWIACTLLTVLFVVLVNYSAVSNGSALIRKVFHLIITAVYVPGMLYDLELLRLASGIALAAFLMLELCRILQIPVIASLVENAFQIFLDEKDTGLLILTHIYLLIGCSYPVWLSCKEKGFHINLMSGIISVGIGDTAAAICGKSFGRHKWKGSSKTIEGSVCCFVMQLIFAFTFFCLAGHSFVPSNIMLLVIAVALTTYLEAKTSQVDNLVLPLFMFSLLSLIH